MGDGVVILILAGVGIGIAIQLIKFLVLLIAAHIIVTVVLLVVCVAAAVAWRFTMEEVADWRTDEECRRLEAERTEAGREDLARRSRLLSEAYEEVRRNIDG